MLPVKGPVLHLDSEPITSGPRNLAPRLKCLLASPILLSIGSTILPHQQSCSAISCPLKTPFLIMLSFFKNSISDDSIVYDSIYITLAK